MSTLTKEEIDNLKLDVKVFEELVLSEATRMVTCKTQDELGDAHHNLRYFSHQLYTAKLKYLNHKDEDH